MRKLQQMLAIVFKNSGYDSFVYNDTNRLIYKFGFQGSKMKSKQILADKVA